MGRNRHLRRDLQKDGFAWSAMVVIDFQNYHVSETLKDGTNVTLRAIRAELSALTSRLVA